jgi:uncharacterized RDD family membrane protein YckC
LNTIEINTAQNVRIEYELAGVGRRIFSYLIDLIIMILVFFFTVTGLVSIFGNEIEGLMLFLQILSFIWFGFYTLFSEVLGNGQTLGKMAMGIKVIKLNGEDLQFYDYFSRWSMRLIDIYLSIGTIAMMLITGNKNGQRLGDIIAGTSIIRKKSSYGFSLKDILRLNEKNREDYHFEYPLAARLEEKDVLLIKNLMYRKRRFNNRAHKEALELLCSKITAILELDKVPENKEVFLNRVISDYIILTR